MPPHGQKPQMLRASRQCNCKGQSNHHNHNTRNLHYTPLQPHIRRCRRSFEFLPAASRSMARDALTFSKALCKGLRFTEKLLKSGSKAARLTPYTQAATSTLERTEFLRWAEASPTPYFRTELRFWAACEVCLVCRPSSCAAAACAAAALERYDGREKQALRMPLRVLCKSAAAQHTHTQQCRAEGCDRW
jgi:hypothetical protein